MSFQEAYENYLIYAQKRHKKQGFITIYTDFNNHVLPYFKDKDIKDLTKNDVIAWQDKILDKNYSNKCNAKLYYVFNNFIDYCILRADLGINENIVRQVGTFPKKIEVKSHVVYNIFQFWWFRFHLNDYVIKQYFTFIYNYGTRSGETMAFKFTDLKGFKLHVIHNLHRKGKRELDTPKNQSSIRYLKISLLCKFRFWRLKKYYLKKYSVFSNDYFIFGGITPLSPTTIDRRKKEAYIKAKLPPITQHEFRHSYATRKIHKKVPIDVVSRSMGHSKVSTTLDIYLHQEKNTF